MKNNRKKIILFCLGIVILGLIIIVLSKDINFKQHTKENNNEQEFTTGLAMMLETDVDSGEYIKNEDTSWSNAIAKGYTFNAEKSTCKNGSTISWNANNNTIIFSGSSTDNCTIYFDKEILAITSAEGIGGEDNITHFTINSTGNATKYKYSYISYSCDEPGSKQEGETTTNTFSLETPSECEEYAIFTIIAIDSSGNQSEPYVYQQDWNYFYTYSPGEPVACVCPQ